MKTTLVVLFFTLLAGCAAAGAPGCGPAMSLSAGCTEGQNPIPYGD